MTQARQRPSKERGRADAKLRKRFESIRRRSIHGAANRSQIEKIIEEAAAQVAAARAIRQEKDMERIYNSLASKRKEQPVKLGGYSPGQIISQRSLSKCDDLRYLPSGLNIDTEGWWLEETEEGDHILRRGRKKRPKPPARRSEPTRKPQQKPSTSQPQPLLPGEEMLRLKPGEDEEDWW